MMSLQKTKNYLSYLRTVSPRNLMIPVVISLIGAAIFIKKKVPINF